ncbi:UDP-galactopyranose mutase [Maridesulfovibrio hydrothermalis]|uniref:UDP-galactopyranose mutase n=1 Tax=Maridesulfovibrio hydrothermalis AM13 = DSM 14728 TaxID=1121451 RepID=L0R7X9_9BACT|nr:UDP-galactopyranose mutase [Maridesulfovibrio hydrothermalis]CCO22844.1 UDP-galactopyranose mutase [Maridesulfovibrio hydrothermalis AM13 = DSM 14728]
MNYKHLIVGAGITGSIIARCIAEKGERVLIIDSRDHIGGNCHSRFDAQTGVEVHSYGTHIFHTDERRVWDFLRRFTQFNSYRHKVVTTYEGRTYHMPVNLQTINSFFGISLKPYEVEGFIRKQSEKENITDPQNLEEKAISLIGRELYEAFVKGYTLKQWECDPKELPVEIITRLPFRHNYECDYFTCRYQGLPWDGYEKMFENMLDHELIDVQLNTDFFDIKGEAGEDCTVYYSGPIDKYFDYCHGELTWRSLRFEYDVEDVADFQGTSVMNYADIDVPYTRVHEYQHLHPERENKSGRTVVAREYSMKWQQGEEPYYPVNTQEDADRMELYRKEAAKLDKVHFLGRLGRYKYYDMDKAVLAALEFCDTALVQS